MNEAEVMKDKWKDARIDGAEILFHYDEKGYAVSWSAQISDKQKYGPRYYVPEPIFSEDLLEVLKLGFSESKRDILSGRLK